MLPQIIPIQDLENTNNISNMCNKSNEPIYITKDGCEDMVIMSAKAYNEKIKILDIYSNIELAENDIRNGNVGDAKESLKKLRGKFNV